MSDKQRDSLREAIIDDMNLNLTDDQLDQVLADPQVQSCLFLGGVDTCTREAASSFLSRVILGREVPLQGELSPGGISLYWDDLEVRAEEMGYDVFL